MSSPRRYVLTVLAAAILAVPLLTSAVQAQETFQTQWLNISRMTVSFPRASGRDSFSTQGSFNMNPDSIDPATASVQIFIDEWSCTFSASDWRQVGKGRTYAAKLKEGTSFVSAQIAWWIGGSSRCNFKFTGARLDIQSGLYDPWYYEDSSEDPTPGSRRPYFDLSINSVFEESLMVTMLRHGGAGRMVYLPERYAIDKVALTRNLTKPNRDSITVTGRLFIDPETMLALIYGDIDPYSIGAVVTIGSLPPIWIEPGSMKWSWYTCRLSYSGTLPTGGKVSISSGLVLGKTVVSVRNIDLSDIADNTLGVGVEFTDVFSGGYQLILQSNAKGTALKY